MARRVDDGQSLVAQRNLVAVRQRLPDDLGRLVHPRPHELLQSNAWMRGLQRRGAARMIRMPVRDDDARKPRRVTPQLGIERRQGGADPRRRRR